MNTNSSTSIKIITNGVAIPIEQVSHLTMRTLAGVPINTFNSNEDILCFFTDKISSYVM